MAKKMRTLLKAVLYHNVATSLIAHFPMVAKSVPQLIK